jgi:hypothetical protein
MLCGATLAAGASCTFDVAFAPAASGTLSAMLNIADSAVGSPQTVALSGTGLPNSPTVAFNGIGSSAMFLELGLAASAATTASPAGLGATCLWSTSTSGKVVATDNSTNGGGKTDTGSAWVAWTPVGGSCSTVNTTTTIYAYLQTDSVVGNRCLFNGCTIANSGSGTASAGIIAGTANEVPLASGVAAALNAAGTVTAAGTDIRPEDAEFAITRALTACGQPVVAGSQYLGLGYTNGQAIQSYFGGPAVNVINFALPSAYSVLPIGATPVVVVVNGDGTTNGFGDPGINNIQTGTLASFLDGTFATTQAALTVPATGNTEYTLTYIREPLSGTYNTVEYNTPNTQSQKTSQDVGLNQPPSQVNCTGTAVKSNPMVIVTGGGHRVRTIGTSQELTAVMTHPQSLGYAFWSVSNFKGFTAAAAPNARYVQMDGVDPLQTVYTGGTIPTTPAQIANVNLAGVANGAYPIWSNIRLVNLGSKVSTVVNSLGTAAQNFAVGTTRPDFIPFNSLTVVRSHFIPPAGTGEPTTPSNGSNRACSALEVGGDVGGVPLTKVGDYNYCYDFSLTTGETGRRK